MDMNERIYVKKMNVVYWCAIAFALGIIVGGSL